MDATEKHYARLLGLEGPWKVTRVKLSVEKMRVDIFIEYGELTGLCPECGAACRVYDHPPGRTWRHLDTMQFGTYLHCEPPRAECARHGIKTIRLPWAGKHSRFTQLFEAFAIKVILASRSLKDAGDLLGLGWHPLHSIMKRAVERGLERRGNDKVAWIGMDEKSFRYQEAFDAGLPEIRKVARMLNKHLENILTYFDCYITNAASEGLNSKIQAIKANARGFRNFENYRVSILFFCGKLELSP